MSTALQCSPGRKAACDHLTAVVSSFPDLPLAGVGGDGALDGMDGRDAGLARAIDGAVRRRWMTLTALLERRLDRPFDALEPPLQAVLLAGAAQLLLLERVPDHAIVHESVEWSKHAMRVGAGRMVNAVLRSLARHRDEAEVIDSRKGPLAANELPLEDGRLLRWRSPVFEQDRTMRLAQQTSHAPLLISRWSELFGEARSEHLALHGIMLAPTIVTGPVGEDPDLERHSVPGFHVLRPNAAPIAGILARHPQAWVQDPTSAAAVAATAGASPKIIVDCCAGRGTKTRQLLHVHPKAMVIAADPDPVRFAALREAFARETRAEIVPSAQLAAAVTRRGGADLVLLDVPCSNSGVLARRLEARYRFTGDRLADLVQLQRHIVRQAVAMLNATGRLLYATCSVEPEENHAQWAWMESQIGLLREASDALLPKGAPGEPPNRYSDGGAWALFTRRS